MFTFSIAVVYALARRPGFVSVLNIAVLTWGEIRERRTGSGRGAVSPYLGLVT